MIKAPPTPKGFRDIAPELATKRRAVIGQIVEVLENLGFVPIETPTIEFAETLTGKYGDEEKLIYKFTDRGGRELALRYDLTVPFARFVASNLNLIGKEPFRRYQIGQVFRGENPQAGRFREFTHLDFDVAGPLRRSDSEARSTDIEEEAKIIACALKSARNAGVRDAAMAINDRENFAGIPINVVRAYDKIHKIKKEGVVSELKSQNLSQGEIENYLDKLINAKPTQKLKSIFEILCSKYKMNLDREFFFDSSLARGLDYYTGPIFELKASLDLTSLSIGGGGRYDNLIQVFAGKKIPAVGFSIGLDRLIEAL